MNDVKDATREERQEILKGIIRDLHSGVPVKKLQKTFAKLIKNVSPEEIADMENALIQEGFPVEEVQRLCEVHAEVFDKSLKKVGKPAKIPGHPMYTFVEENKAAKKILKDLKRSLKPLAKGRAAQEDIDKFSRDLARLKEIEIHYQRKENQLFPLLEAKGFLGPTKVMWGKHDEIRAHLKKTAELLQAGEWAALAGQVKALSGAIKKMIFLEEKILYPTSARKLGLNDWVRIKQGEPAIGYAWVKPSNLWDARLAEAMGGGLETADAEESLVSEAPPGASQEDLVENNNIPLSTGRLPAEQIDLMLKTLPIDITFVDENDEVAYYSDTSERIFPRSPAIVGRDVQNCHPPKSVHVVNDIVKAFKEKTKDVAEFWIQKDGLFIHIRYFPVYDAEGRYRGVIEVSQELSKQRALEGERRLLDW
ncbi:MAG: DUF438 domain-containing protein [Acidobacteriota bacterium]|nr:DUF438 domain-containing protein [Acidobacteriota bacterium]